MKQIIYYKTKSGKCPYLDWYNNLDNDVKNRIRARLERLEEDNFGDCKKINRNLSELRFKFGSSYRIYYFEYENTIIILLTAGNKATQNKDIMKAKEYIADFEERYKND